VKGWFEGYCLSTRPRRIESSQELSGRLTSALNNGFQLLRGCKNCVFDWDLYYKQGIEIEEKDLRNVAELKETGIISELGIGNASALGVDFTN
jgi:hypothetical protein